MRRVVAVAACVVGLLWVAPVTGNADIYADLAVGVSFEDSGASRPASAPRA